MAWKFYEGMFLVHNDLGVRNPAEAQELVKSTIAKQGGEVHRLEKWDERKLAYEIEGQKRGTYFLCYFFAPSDAPKKIERAVALNDQLLRCLVLNRDAKKDHYLKWLQETPSLTWTDSREGQPEDAESRDDQDDRAPRPRRSRSDRHRREDEDNV